MPPPGPVHRMGRKDLRGVLRTGAWGPFVSLLGMAPCHENSGDSHDQLVHESSLEGNGSHLPGLYTSGSLKRLMWLVGNQSLSGDEE